MRIVILHNAVSEDSAPDERDVLVQADAVLHALTRLGHDASLLACDLNLEQLKDQLSVLCPDLVFNLVESLDGQGRLIHLVPFLLDSLKIAYTGAPSEAVYATSNKLMAKSLLLAHQLPTPLWAVADFSGAAQIYSSPNDNLNENDLLIVKSVWEHASLGLDGNGLVPFTTSAALGRVMHARTEGLGGNCFAERYIEGREFNLALLAGADGPEVLSPAEILFEDYRPDQARIVCYRAKWDEDSFEYHHTPRRFEFSSNDHLLLEKLKATARKCWHLFGLKGYARVDFRVDSRNQIWILEINTNPCLAPDAGFYAAMTQSGMTFDQAIARIVADAFNRVAISEAEEERSFSKVEQTQENDVRPDHVDPLPELRETVRPSDVEMVRALTMDTGFFLPMEVEVAVELVKERLEKGAASGYDFLFWDQNGRLTAYTCFGLIPCTRSSYDLYWIAVQPEFQQKGIGRRLMQAAEKHIARLGGTQIYVETSQRPLYESTRNFYERCGYVTAAVMPDFYGPDDGKVVLYKKLE